PASQQPVGGGSLANGAQSAAAVCPASRVAPPGAAKHSLIACSAHDISPMRTGSGGANAVPHVCVHEPPRLQSALRAWSAKSRRSLTVVIPSSRPPPPPWFCCVVLLIRRQPPPVGLLVPLYGQRSVHRHGGITMSPSAGLFATLSRAAIACPESVPAPCP